MLRSLLLLLPLSLITSTAEAQWKDGLSREERAAIRAERWAKDRTTIVTIGVAPFMAAGPSRSFTFAALAAEITLGLRKRLHRWIAAQGRLGIGGGFGDDFSRALTASSDASIRIGPNRFFFGLGTHLAAISMENRGGPIFLGGGLAEIGWYLGYDRVGELTLRAQAGTILNTLGDGAAPYVSGSLCFGWGIEP